MTQMQEYELAVGRGHVDGFTEFLARMEEARATVAALITGDPDDIALTHSVTEGVNSAINGLDWEAGDGAAVTTTEHIGGSGPLFNQRLRRGIDLRLVDIGDGADADAVVAAYAAAIDDRTKAIVVSHVMWSLGAVLPVRAIADVAHAHGALVVGRRRAGRGCHPDRPGRPSARTSTRSRARSGCSARRGRGPSRSRPRHASASRRRSAGS